MVLRGLDTEVVEYLRENGVLAGRPVFENRKKNIVCVDPRGQWEEYYMAYPFWQEREVDVHREDFERMENLLERTDFDDVQEKALREIPDSPDTAILEIGSEYGTAGAGWLAAHKPNAQVILVSDPREEPIKPTYLFRENRMKRNRLIFKDGISLLSEPDIVRRTNALYHANGIRNVTYHEHKLTMESTFSLPGFLRELQSRNVYIFGHNSPGELPFIIGEMYDRLHAKQMCISMTAPEKIAPDSWVWADIARQLRLGDDETKGYSRSSFGKGPDGMPLIDYLDAGQKRVGVMMKLGMALSLAKKSGGEVLRNRVQQDSIGYNKCDFYVEAKR